MMPNKTKIEWVKNPDGTQGYTWNPITGCLNGCPYCYARKLANGRLRERYLANINYIGQDTGLSLDDVNNLVGRVDPFDDPFYPRFWPERLYDLGSRKYAKPRGIFVCDMGELFGDWIPEVWQEQIFYTIKLLKQHRFYLLTKQPQNLAKWSPFPENCWVGATVTHDGMMQATQEAFDGIVAKHNFISIEPFLSRFSKASLREIEQYVCHWLIIGAQTKPYLPPKIEWVQEIVEAADRAGVKVFLKDNLKPILPVQEPFYYWEDYGGGKQDDEDDSTNILLRQELP